MRRNLSRLLSPRSVAIIGGGAWCDAVLAQLQKAGFDGAIWLVHPSGGKWRGLERYPALHALPGAPDLGFIGINRTATIDAARDLSDMKAGGAVCFASGFAEVEGGDNLNSALLDAAGDMPILGPNCYGLINALDGVMLWPDQHGCAPVKSGVAIVTQSSNIAINLTMQSRGLPIAYVATCGNQAQTTQADIALGLLDDERVTAIGFHIEGFKDLRAWEALAKKARDKNIPLVALKTGRSDEARAATVSHTASLAGEDSGARALLRRLGIAEVNDLATFLETLKLMHVEGWLPNANIASISCSGGEAALVADLGKSAALNFPPLTHSQHLNLGNALGPKVALANPLDYHTYIWRDLDAMTAAFSAMIEPHLAMTILVLDFPRNDICDPADWDIAVEAVIRAKKEKGGPFGVVASLPELMPEPIAQQFLAHGIIPFSGLREALGAIAAAVERPADLEQPVALPHAPENVVLIDEANAKAELAAFGVKVPQSIVFRRDQLPATLDWDAALKGTGLAHKSETGAVVLNLTSLAEVRDAVATLPGETFLLEEMVEGGVAELLIGVTLDLAHGYILTLGAGGTLTELIEDSQSLLIPADRPAIKDALGRLKVSKLLHGYRGKPAAHLDSILDAIEAVQAYVLAHQGTVAEVEINPLICTAHSAIAADALIRRTDDTSN